MLNGEDSNTAGTDSEMEEAPAMPNGEDSDAAGEASETEEAPARASKKKTIILAAVCVAAAAAVALIVLIASGVLPFFAESAPEEPAVLAHDDTVNPAALLPSPEGWSEAGLPDYDAAFAAFAPGTVMMRAGGYAVTWEELYIGLREGVAYLVSMREEGENWTELGPTGETLNEWLLQFAAERAVNLKAYEYGAAINGISLSAEDLDELNRGYAETAAQFGGEDEFLRVLRDESGFYSRELFEYYVSTSFLIEKVFIGLYGQTGEKFPDADVAELTAGDGLLTAKHILIQKPEGDGDPAAELSEAEDILAQLEAYDGGEFDEFFDELMFAFSEDQGGLASYPEGYLFQNGDMVPEFYEGTVALDIGEISGIVETAYGYHIIYRLPVNYDLVPFSLYMQGQQGTLRQLMVQETFGAMVQEWKDGLDLQYTAEYDSIDVIAIFS